MNTETTVPNPTLFAPHPNFSDEINRNIIQSEIEGGVYLDNQVEGSVLEVETQHHFYTILNRGEGQALISGHPKFCPTPVLVRIEGSTWGGSMLKSRFIGREMHLEFRHPVYRTITTSRITLVRFRPGAGAAAQSVVRRNWAIGETAGNGEVPGGKPECPLFSSEKAPGTH